MALERLTKDNFVDHPPFFPVYDYWYNILVDAINELAVLDASLDGSTVTLTSTNAGAAADPELDLYRNSASPAALDVLGEVVFNGNDSVGNKEEYARIQAVITDPTSTTEDGVLQVFTKHGGSNSTYPQLQISDTSANVIRTDNGAEGATLQMSHISASPAAADAVGMIKFIGQDSAGNAQEYAQISGTIEDPTTTQEDGSIQLKVVVAGTITEVAEIHGTGITVVDNVKVGDGVVGTPSLQIGDADTGFYKVSDAQTGFSQDGSLVFMTNSAIGSGALQVDYIVNTGAFGSTPVGTVDILEYGYGKDFVTVLTLTNFIVGALDGAAAAKAIGNIVYAFPAGQHIEVAYAFSALVLTAAGTPVNTDTGLGSVIASGVEATIDGTATFQDRLTGQTIATAAAGGAAVSALTAATAGPLTGIALNGTTASKNVFLNSAGTWNADNTGNLTASGKIILKWSIMS